MPFPVHTVEFADGSQFSQSDRLTLFTAYNVANAAGSGAGASVTVPISVPSGLPASYGVSVTPSQACFDAVTSKTQTGFNIVLTPTGSGVTLAAGTLDVIVFA